MHRYSLFSFPLIPSQNRLFLARKLPIKRLKTIIQLRNLQPPLPLPLHRSHVQSSASASASFAVSEAAIISSALSGVRLAATDGMAMLFDVVFASEVVFVRGGGVSESVGLGGSSPEARRTLSGGMVRRPFLKTYFAIPVAKICGCRPFESTLCALPSVPLTFLHGCSK